MKKVFSAVAMLVIVVLVACWLMPNLRNSLSGVPKKVDRTILENTSDEDLVGAILDDLNKKERELASKYRKAYETKSQKESLSLALINDKKTLSVAKANLADCQQKLEEADASGKASAAGVLRDKKDLLRQADIYLKRAIALRQKIADNEQVLIVYTDAYDQSNAAIDQMLYTINQARIQVDVKKAQLAATKAMLVAKAMKNEVSNIGSTQDVFGPAYGELNNRSRNAKADIEFEEKKAQLDGQSFIDNGPTLKDVAKEIKTFLAESETSSQSDNK